MNPSTIPATCSLALTAVVAAGISHWWSVRQFTDLLEHGVPMAPAPASVPEPQAAQPLLATIPAKHTTVEAAMAATGSKSQQDFFEALIEKMSQMESQNRDLHDQLAETNRDMMKLQFRVDMNSESFRPLPVAEDKPLIGIGQGSVIDNAPSVLPPRAEPIRLPSYE